jgi:protease-4
LGAVAVGGSGGGGLVQAQIAEGNDSEKIAVIPIHGIIDANAAAYFDRYMKTAEQDASVKAIVLDIDSPGGTISGSDQIYHRIRRFKQNKPNTPVVVSMGSLAASGGYYAACAADHLFAQRTTMTGSIGVIMPSMNFSKLMEKYGVEENSVISSGAPFKNAGSPTAPMTEQHRAYYQALCDQAFDQFKTIVKDGRKGKLTVSTVDEVANGKVYSAADALKLGLIDQEGYLEDAWKYAATAAGLSKPTVVRYQVPPTLFQQLLARGGVPSPLAQQSGNGTTINVNLNLDPSLLEQFTAPRPLYLWRGQ